MLMEHGFCIHYTFDIFLCTMLFHRKVSNCLQILSEKCEVLYKVHKKNKHKYLLRLCPLLKKE